MSTLTRRVRVDGVLTDPSSITLSDSTDTYGVKRNDTDAVVVADETAMTRVGTGVYKHTFEDPADALIYTWAVEVVYGGITYRSDGTLAGPTGAEDVPSASADKSVDINTNAQSPAEVSQDGTTVKMPPVADQIAADRYAATRAAHARKSTGLRFHKIVPPGSI